VQEIRTNLGVPEKPVEIRNGKRFGKIDYKGEVS